MGKTGLALIVLSAALSCTLAFATPSTLVWIPSTDIQADDTWHLGVDSYFALNSGSTAIVDVGPEYGFLNGRAEVGVDVISNLDEPLFFNLKFLVTPERRSVPAVAVGIYNVGTDSGVTDFNMAFVLGSKTFGPARLHLGYCHGNKGMLGQDADMLMAGVDGYLTRDKKWWGAVDYQGGQSVFGALSVGAAYYLTDKISLILGYDIYNNSALNPNDTITTQLDINF